MTRRRRNLKPNQSLTTADHLARAVYDDLLPQHRQTCEDYGFNRAITVEEKCNLLGLYIGLIKYMDIPPKTIHDWRVRGVLVDEIKATFYEVPECSRGAYFPWFLRNQHIVASAGQPLSAGAFHESVWDLKGFVLQKDSASEESGMCPSVMVDYGFINCRNASERQQLKKVYKDFFNNHHGDPLALHKAAIKGNLYGFLSNIVQGLQDPKFERLMKNPYPLLDLDIPRRSLFSAWQALALLFGVLVMLSIWMLPL